MKEVNILTGSSTSIRKKTFKMKKIKPEKKSDNFDVSIVDISQDKTNLIVKVNGTGKTVLFIDGIRADEKDVNGEYIFTVNMIKKPHFRLLYETGKKFTVEIRKA